MAAMDSHMKHPVEAHIAMLELLMLELRFELNHELDSSRRIRLSDRIYSLYSIVKSYRAGLEAEERLLAGKVGAQLSMAQSSIR